MGLQQILNDFSQEVSGNPALGLNSLPLYPNHFITAENGGFNYPQSTTPIFDGILSFTGGTDSNGNPTFTTTRFRQKNYKFGQFPAFDRPGLGFSPEPFIQNPINLLSDTDVGSLINTVTDGTIRGGLLLHTARNLNDVARITQWGTTPEGLAWNAKQIGLQLTNPKISEPVRGTGASNQRTYNPLNTIAQIGVEGTGVRFTREGALGFAGVHQGYLDHKAILGLNEDEERDPSSKLSTLFVNHILEDKSHDPKGKGGQKPPPADEKSGVGKFLEKAAGKVGDFFNNLLSKDGEPLYSYSGGPHSLYGIGRTEIRKYAPFINQGNDRIYGSQNTDALLVDRELFDSSYTYPYGGIIPARYPQLNLDGFEGIPDAFLPIYSKYHSKVGVEADGEIAGFDRLSNSTERDDLTTHYVHDRGVYRIGDTIPPISGATISRTGFGVLAQLSIIGPKNNNSNELSYVTNQYSGVTDFSSTFGGEIIESDGAAPINGLSVFSPNLVYEQNSLNYSDRISREILNNKDIRTPGQPGTLLDENEGYEFIHNPILLTDIQDFRMIRRGIEEPTDAATNVDNHNVTNYKASTNLGQSGFYRETRVNTGNVGQNMDNSTAFVNHFGETTNDYDKFDPVVIDKINALDVYREGYESGDRREKSHMRDLIRLKIEALDSSSPDKAETMLFRAFLDSYSDKFTGDWNSFKYNGRAEDFYTYKGFKRSISFSFKIAAQTRHEMLPLFRKLNFLATQTAPDYQNTRMRGSFCRLTIGSMLQRTPGFFTSVGIKWNKNYPWDIAINHLENGPDKDGAAVMPHLLDVSCQFTPVHTFIPQKSVWKSPFILPHTGANIRRNWSKEDAAANSDEARFDKPARWQRWST